MRLNEIYEYTAENFMKIIGNLTKYVGTFEWFHPKTTNNNIYKSY